jgi:hypothetical protein
MLQASFVIAILIYGTLAASGQGLTADCPTLRIEGPQGMSRKGERISISVNVPGNLSYEWNVSKGQIVRGQGTHSIVVDTKDVEFEAFGHVTSVVVEAKLRGLPDHCVSMVSDRFGVYVIADIFPIDDYSDIPRNDEASRLDNLIVQMRVSKVMIGYIVLYARPAEITKLLKQRVPRIRRHLFMKSKEPLDRYVMLVLPTKEKSRTELWLWPRDPRAGKFPLLNEPGVRVIANK